MRSIWARRKTRRRVQLAWEIFYILVVSTARRNSNPNRRSNSILRLSMRHLRQTQEAILCSYLWKGKYRRQGWARRKTRSVGQLPMAFILFVSSVRKNSNQIRRFNNIVRCIRHFRLVPQALKYMNCHCRWKYRRLRARRKIRSVGQLSEIFNWLVASSARKNSNRNRRSNNILQLCIKHFRQTKKAIQCSYL